MEPSFPALSYHFKLSPSEIDGMPLRLLKRYLEALDVLMGGDDG